jgi:hypothetical protein
MGQATDGQTLATDTPHHREATKTFVAKREPVFQGR